jgi:hypothetical protein
MIEREIKTFLLKALLAAHPSPMPDDSLRGAIRGAFPHVALTGGDLGQYIRTAESQGMIAGTNDEVFGLMWALTPQGKIRAQSL